MTEIKPWQDRVKPGAFTGVKMEAMLAEIAEHRAAKVEQGKPVAPVAWRGWDGDKWVFTLWREEMPVQFEWQPLFTHPVRTMSDEQQQTKAIQHGISLYSNFELLDGKHGALKRALNSVWADAFSHGFHAGTDIKGATE
mgnify:FL=1